MLNSEQFPRSNKYDPKWIFENQIGPNPLWLTEFLVQPFELKPGDMSILFWTKMSLPKMIKKVTDRATVEG